MSNPGRTVAYLLMTFAVIGGIMLVWPSEGVRVTDDFVLDFPDWDGFWAEDKPQRRVALQELFDIYSLKIDSTAIRDSIKRAKIAHQQEMKWIQFADSTMSACANFFEAVNAGAQRQRMMRIMHYGDSQIEGDRITGYLRHQLQGAYGGQGSGWLSLVEVIPTPVMDYTSSDNWYRYTAYGRPQSIHTRYGMLAGFHRFIPEEDTVIVDNLREDGVDTIDVAADQGNEEVVTTVEDGAIAEQDTVRAWVELKPKGGIYGRTQKFSRIRMAYGNIRSLVAYKLYLDGELYQADSLRDVAFYNELVIDVEDAPGVIRFEFEGVDSPDFYGISLEPLSGLVVDNIPLRGSSGTFFNKIDRLQLKEQYDRENVGLFILQFGGNSVPYIDDEKRAEDFGRWFGAQIRTLRQLNPESSFIVIGPSDMSIKDKDKFVTYPMLASIRDALQKASFEAGAAYWDLFEAMGGPGSMPQWVNVEPALASTDHIHFTPKGAKVVSEWFYEALMKAFDDYRGVAKQ